MGGDLTQGTIKGDEIACPFHDWRWGGDGKCKLIPYAKRTPAAGPHPRLARPMCAAACCSSGTTPRATRRRPRCASREIAEFASDEWTDWPWNSMLIEGSNCREIIDNVVDMAHFFYIHFAFPTYFKNVFEGHIASQYLHNVGRAGRERPRAPSYGEAHLRLGGVVLRAVVHDQLAAQRLRGLQGRVDPDQLPLPGRRQDSFVLQYGVIVEKPEGPRRGDDREAGRRRSPKASARASCRTSRSGRTRPASTTRCCARRTAPSTSCAAGTSSSTSTSPTSRPR